MAPRFMSLTIPSLSHRDLVFKEILGSLYPILTTAKQLLKKFLARSVASTKQLIKKFSALSPYH